MQVRWTPMWQPNSNFNSISKLRKRLVGNFRRWKSITSLLLLFTYKCAEISD
jgi:hypothetical protein